MTTKTVNRNLNFNTEERNSDSSYRCKYGDKNLFDVLEINIHYQNECATFTIDSKYLPDRDSISFKAYKDGDNISLIWSPKYIEEHIIHKC